MKQLLLLSIWFFLFALPLPSVGLAQTNCIDADGEAVIVGNDIPSARGEAVSRAKWAAVEQAVGVGIKAQSVVQNMMLVDEAVSKQINGSVKRYRMLSQSTQDGVLKVRINACVETSEAKDTLAGLALNNALSVFLLAKDRTGKTGSYEDWNILSESLIGKLADRGYTVTDIAETGALDQKALNAALKSGKLTGLNTLAYRFLSNVVLLGKVDYSLATRKGEDVGYGISTPFNNVRARLTYRLISKGAAGQMTILAAGSAEGNGLAGRVEDAAAESLKDLAEKLAPAVLKELDRHLQGVSKRIEVRVIGISELNENFAVKEIFQNLAWVNSVSERGLGEFTVSYQENTIYLANSIGQQGNFKIVSFTPDSITVDYAK